MTSRPLDSSASREPAAGARAPWRRLAGRFRRATANDGWVERVAVARADGAACWEQDVAGRYLRIDGAPLGEGLVGALLGRARWDCGGRVAGSAVAGSAVDGSAVDGSAAAGSAVDGWTRHRQAVADRLPFGDLVWIATAVGGEAVVLRESGAPRYAADGRFLGWSGLMRNAGASLDDARVARALGAALAGAATPFMRIVAAANDAGWRPASANGAACALLGRTEADALAADPFAWLRDAPVDGNAPSGAGIGAGSPDAAIGAQSPHAAVGTESPDAPNADVSPCAAIGDALAHGGVLRRRALVVDPRGSARTVDLVLDAGVSRDALPAIGTLWLDPAPAEDDATRSRIDALERALAERGAKLRELASAARELELFSSAVSHDLRAPLRVVDGFATILKEDFAGVLGRFGIDHVGRIIAATGRMNQMIDSMLKLARVSSGPIACEPVDLATIARCVVDELRMADPHREVRVDVAPGLQARGDPTLLRIVVENLIGNAWKYTGRTAGARIAFDAFDDGTTAVYRVADNGAGFDMRFANRLFRVFQRLHGTAEFPGTGVGLATVARIVRRHGGRIWADSAPGEGARFHFTLNEDPPDGAGDRAPVGPH